MKRKQLKIKKAKHTGFCFGVRRAIGIAEDFLKKNKKVYSLGPIIHNTVVVEELSKKGLKVIDDIKQAKGAHILIRSHGISPRLIKKAQELSIGLVDATCPFVKRSHGIVTLLKRQGYQIIIIGERKHPEIEALSEVAGRDTVVVTRDKDIKRLNLKKRKIAVVAQTTISRDDFLRITTLLLNSGYFECRIFDTICNDVIQRQSQIKKIAKASDVVIVVGGKMSANTKHLTRICRDMGTRTYHIETKEEMKPSWYRTAATVGVASGASTPEKLVNEVVSRLSQTYNTSAPFKSRQRLRP